MGRGCGMEFMRGAYFGGFEMGFYLLGKRKFPWGVLDDWDWD